MECILLTLAWFLALHPQLTARTTRHIPGCPLLSLSLCLSPRYAMAFGDAEDVRFEAFLPVLRSFWALRPTVPQRTHRVERAPPRTDLRGRTGGTHGTDGGG